MKNSKLIVGILIVGFLVLGSIYSIYLISKPIALEIQGEVDAKQVKVGSKLPGRIDSLMVYKGQDVDTGTLLFTISSPEVDAKLSQANAVLEAAQAQSQKASNGARAEDIQAAFNIYQKAKAAADYTKKSYQRVLNLYNDGVLAEQKKDEVETQMIAAVETEKAAKSVYEKARAGARQEDKRAAGALVKQADGVVTEVLSYLSETHVYAPLKGEIANIIAEEGELVPTGYPVVTIVDLENVWITFNLREDLLADISKGMEFDARFPALGMKKLKLKISYIHALGDFATWTATKTSGDFDMKTFEVHAVPVQKSTGLRPGMTALVNWDDLKVNNSND